MSSAEEPAAALGAEVCFAGKLGADAHLVVGAGAKPFMSAPQPWMARSRSWNMGMLFTKSPLNMEWAGRGLPSPFMNPILAQS